MLLAVQELAPALYHFVQSSYSAPSCLFWYDSVLQSVEGVQQGDPLGPLLFCLSIHKSLLPVEVRVQRVVLDSSVGGTCGDVRYDLEIVQHVGSESGPHLNHQKSEVIIPNLCLLNPFCLQSQMPRCWTQQVLPCLDPLLRMLPLSLLPITTRFTTLPPCMKDFSTQHAIGSSPSP